MNYIIGGGISGLLSAYYLAKKHHKIVIVEPNNIGGEFLTANHGSRWFYYTPLMENLLIELGIQYQIKQQTGAVLFENELHIFPDYAKINPKCVEKYYYKTRGKRIIDGSFDINTYNGMNEINNDNLNHRLVLYFNEQELLAKLLVLTAKFAYRLEHISGKLILLRTAEKYIEIESNKGDKIRTNYDKIIITIPLNIMSHIWKDIPSEVYDYIRGKILENNSNFKITLNPWCKVGHKIWWNYVYLPEFDYIPRRIVYRQDITGEYFVLEVMNFDASQINEVSSAETLTKVLNMKITKDHIQNIDLQLIKGFVDNYDLYNHIQDIQDIYFFGRYALWNHVLTVDRTYDSIVKELNF